jgi:glycosyltransferase involved in cell wall biosynthesis
MGSAASKDVVPAAGRSSERRRPTEVAAAHPAVLLIGGSLVYGGTEGQFVEVARGLNAGPWDVRVSCVRAEGPLRAPLEAAGLRAWSCGRGSFKSFRFAAAVFSLARYLRAERIRLVHSFDFYSNILGMPAARLAGVPVTIASQRELGDLRSSSELRAYGCAQRLAHCVLVNSEAVAERVRLQGAVQPGRLVVIPNGVDLGRFSPAPRTARPPDRPVTIGTLSVLRPEKGLAHLLQAAASIRRSFPRSRFVIWGEGPLRPELERLIGQLSLGGVVELRGATAEPEVALRELDIFVLPSLSEACSNALLQAMASGLAVVATRVGGTPAVVTDEESGLLVAPGDPAALARAITRLIEEPALADRLRGRARTVVCARFGSDRMLDRIEALYRQLLGMGSGPPDAGTYVWNSGQA